MNKVIHSREQKLPIKMWLDNIEDGALEQAKHLANLPFACKHIAIMPDSHQGYGMPIGGVMAPGAYKDIDVVMKNQEDLVEIVTELSPLAVIKG